METFLNSYSKFQAVPLRGYGHQWHFHWRLRRTCCPAGNWIAQKCKSEWVLMKSGIMHTPLKKSRGKQFANLQWYFGFCIEITGPVCSPWCLPSACRFSQCSVLLSEVALEQFKHQQHESAAVTARPSNVDREEWPHAEQCHSLILQPAAAFHSVFLVSKWASVILPIVVTFCINENTERCGSTWI